MNKTLNILKENITTKKEKCETSVSCTCIYQIMDGYEKVCELIEEEPTMLTLMFW